MILREYLSIPYLLHVTSIYDENEGWIRKASFPELPYCSVEHFSTLEAIEQLEKLKIELICKKLNLGEPIPYSNPPLNDTITEEQLQRWGYGRLVMLLDEDERRLKGKLNTLN